MEGPGIVYHPWHHFVRDAWNLSLIFFLTKKKQQPGPFAIAPDLRPSSRFLPLVWHL